jgi:hypothetical protein
LGSTASPSRHSASLTGPRWRRGVDVEAAKK